VAVVSPWVSDVRVSFPLNDRGVETRMYFSEAVNALADETDVKLYLRSSQDHNQYIQSKLGDDVEIEMVSDLHAKAIVTDETVYVGSANVTLSGLSVNRELCHIVENSYGSIDDYLYEELELDA
jgi:phosphatidylserine/phosphatidylglycerophosphate/cardiolipin synthase-like enzyme